MARPSNKPATTEPTSKAAEPFNLPAPISDPQLEMMYLLGHLRGRIATADRIAELHLTIVNALKERIGES